MEILIGIIAGVVTSIGMGGGTILILLLTIILNVPQHTAQAVNLMFFIPTSITAIIINFKNKNIDLKLGIHIIIYGIIGSIIGAIISNKINVQNLRKYFGIFLLGIAIHETYNFYKEYIKNKNTHTKIENQEKVKNM